MNIDFLETNTKKGEVTFMEFKVIQDAITINESVYEGSTEHVVDCEMNLPDYCPDIQRILKCQIIPGITQSQVTGSRLTVEGTAIVRVMYLDESGSNAIRCFEQSYPFSKIIELNSTPESPSVILRTKTEYVNCRATGPRKLDVHGAFSIKAKVNAKHEEQFITNAEGAGIQLRRRQMNVCNTVGDTEHVFSMDETLEIGDSKPPIKQIIRSDAAVVLGEFKVINNKILLKGELIVKTLYCADFENGALESIEHTLPISQIIDIEGISEECICDINLHLLSLSTDAKSDSTNELKLIEINARICAEIHACKAAEIPFVTDAYSVDCELNIDSKVVEFERMIETFNDTCHVQNSVEISDMGISGILDLWCSDIDSTCSKDENYLVICGTMTICALIVDGEGKPEFVEKPVEYEYRREMKENADRIKCEPSVDVKTLDYSIKGGQFIDIRIELSVRAGVFSKDNERIMCGMTPDEEKRKELNNAALTIYFTDLNESVWNIARKYNTTVEAIMLENELNDEVITEKRMLLIPGI